MKSIVTGASGFIGSHLVCLLRQLGDNVVSLGRADFAEGSFDRLCEKISGADRVFNLAGEPIAQRWTDDAKKRIYDSRIRTTEKLVKAINSQSYKPLLMVSTSAIGYYPSDGMYIETADVHVNTFLARVCRDWERAAAEVSSDVRLCITRLGNVLDCSGGMLPRMVKILNTGLAGRVGSGMQFFSWITLHDLLRVYRFIIDRPDISGPVNCTTPDVIDNSIFTSVLAMELRRPALLPVSEWLLKLYMGESRMLLTQGQYAHPSRLIEAGFSYDYELLPSALHYLIGEKREHQNSFPLQKECF